MLLNNLFKNLNGYKKRPLACALAKRFLIHEILYQTLLLVYIKFFLNFNSFCGNRVLRHDEMLIGRSIIYLSVFA